MASESLPCVIKVRADLEKYFEVVSHADRTLRCKLAGRNECKMDGKLAVLTSKTARGWFNFERHLIRVHKFPQETFIKDKSLKTDREFDLHAASDHRMDTDPVEDNTLQSERYCLACLSVFPNALVEDNTMDDEDLINFPGSEGNLQLSSQLLYTFFLRNILDFPKARCERYLKSWKGGTMSEKWFWLCSPCRNIILEAAVIHQKMGLLEKKLNDIKDRIKVTFKDSDACVSTAQLNKIETEIRNSVCGNSGNGHQMDETATLFTAAPKKEGIKEDVITLQDDAVEAFWDPQIKVELPDDKFFPDEEDQTYVSDAESESDDPDSYPLELSPKKLMVENETESEKVPVISNIKTLQRKKKKKSSKQATLATIKREYDQHENWDSAAKSFSCKRCPATYPTLKYFNRHMQDHKTNEQQNKVFECGECGHPCLTPKAREMHMTVKHRKEENRVTQLACSLCSFVATSKKNLLRHMKEHREACHKERINGKFFCNFCDRLFISYALLCRHKRSSHHKEMGWEPIVCTICKGVFSTQRHLSDHVQQTHQKLSKYYCDICGKGFLYMSKLRRHLNSHARENVYVCETCGADFLYAETLRSHVRKDHPESDLPETTDAANNAHKDGESTDSSTKFTCKHCGAELGSSTLLSRHIKSHTELFQHKCDECGRHYATAQSLRRHLEINHTGKQIPCPYCDKKFPHQEYIRAHFRYCRNNPDKRESDKVVGEPLDITLLGDTSNCEGEPETLSAAESRMEKQESQSILPNHKVEEATSSAMCELSTRTTIPIKPGSQILKLPLTSGTISFIIHPTTYQSMTK